MARVFQLAKLVVRFVGDPVPLRQDLARAQRDVLGKEKDLKKAKKEGVKEDVAKAEAARDEAKALEDVLGKATGIIDKIEYWKRITGQIVDNTKALYEWLRKVLDHYGKLQTSAMRLRLQIFAKGEEGAVLKRYQDLADNLSEISFASAKDIRAGIGTALKESADTSEGAIKRILMVALKLQAATGKDLGDLVKAVTAAERGDMEDMISLIGDDMHHAWRKAGNAVIWFEGLQQKVTQGGLAFEEYRDSVEGIFKRIENTFERYQEKIARVLGPPMNRVLKFLNERMEDVFRTINRLTDELAYSFQPVLDHVFEVAGRLGVQFDRIGSSDTFSKLKEVMREIWDTGRLAVESLPRGFDLVMESAMLAWNIIKEIFDTIVEGWEQFTGSTLERSLDILWEYWKAYSAIYSGDPDKVIAALQRAQDKLMDAKVAAEERDKRRGEYLARSQAREKERDMLKSSIAARAADARTFWARRKQEMELERQKRDADEANADRTRQRLKEELEGADSVRQAYGKGIIEDLGGLARRVQEAAIGRQGWQYKMIEQQRESVKVQKEIRDAVRRQPEAKAQPPVKIGVI